MAEEKKEVEKIVFPKKRKRLWYCGMCGHRCASSIELEEHVDKCGKGKVPKNNPWDVIVYRADNIITMQVPIQEIL